MLQFFLGESGRDIDGEHSDSQLEDPRFEEIQV